MLQPLVRRTWAPRGQTPIHWSWDRYDRLSVVAALCLSPVRQRSRLLFHVQDHNLTANDLAMFLRRLHVCIHRPLILICDRWQVHRSAVARLQRERRSWLDVRWLPPYAPDLNPVEALWKSIKHDQLGNFLPDDLADLDSTVRQQLYNHRNDYSTLRSCFRVAQLSLNREH